MTTILPTPAAWPRILLDGEDGAAFAGLRAAVRDLGPTATIATLAAAGLRGRGGGGFPAADKWRTVAEAGDRTRFAVANGFEADPGAGVDRHLMETRAGAIVEGLAIAALSVGAAEAILAVRAEYGAAVAALEAAVAAAVAAGIVGRDVLGSGRDLSISVRTVRGAYMLGEETVLLKALEGRRGQPEQRPPYPATRGLDGHPTLVHSVATLAAVPWILRHGADAFRAIGDAEAPGTMLVQVSGSVRTPGLAEVPTGTPLTDIIDLAGGVPAGRSLKAVLVGGPSGGLLPPASLATPYSFGALRDAGAHVGSGSIVVVDTATCLVDLGRLLTRYCADEACGKTIPCRIGLRRMAEIGERIAAGAARPTDTQLLADLGADIIASGLCDHERRATAPLLTALRYFTDELDAHIQRGECPAGVCNPVSLAAAGPAGGR